FAPCSIFLPSPIPHLSHELTNQFSHIIFLIAVIVQGTFTSTGVPPQAAAALPGWAGQLKRNGAEYTRPSAQQGFCLGERASCPYQQFRLSRQKLLRDESEEFRSTCDVVRHRREEFGGGATKRSS